ncbi:putative ubiquitin-specific processing protease 21 [Rhizophagus irregularis DAOM 181602=DAOM 197198]|nr:putative ubiquitin-specific processing protease 21 [Rhizophagus irregularis DAOM 181602=DAOM 197198]
MVSRETLSCDGVPQMSRLFIYEKYSEVDGYARVLCEKKEFSSDTPLNIYKEIKPNKLEKNASLIHL